MKNIKYLLIVLFLTSSIVLKAQSPQGFNYQTVVRSSSGELLTNQAIGTQFILHQTTATGTAVYTETWSTSTNDYGLLSFAIGSGTTTDDFSLIDWSAGPYYLETLLDVSGGTTYVSMGTTQILSVPFAIHSKIAENVMNETQGLSDVLTNSSDANGQINNLSDPTSNQDATTKSYVDNLIGMLDDKIRDLQTQNPVQIGDYRHGGVVFWIDPNDSNHGMVCAIRDLTSPDPLPWSDVPQGTYVYGTSLALGTAEANTIAIVSVSNESWAEYATEQNYENYSDWFLPSLGDLEEMYVHKNLINATSLANGGQSLVETYPNQYWSSSFESVDNGVSLVWTFVFLDGSSTVDGLTSNLVRRTRLIRKF